MIRKIAFLILLLVFLFSLSGCVKAQRRRAMMGWEYVRIEKQVPQANCRYVIQESCSAGGARCYNIYRQRAKLKGANVVVITDLERGQRSSGSVGVYNGVGGGGYSSVDSITALADFYDCPGYKYGEQK